jgi:hypothetical protein
LILGIDLSSQENLLKYIGGLHSYLRHAILMFNPTNLDEDFVQETHLEARGKQEAILQWRQRKEEIQRKWKEECFSQERGRKTLM